MSSVIEEFLCLHSTKSTPNIQSIWDEIRKEVDPFDEHRIKRALSEQIQKNQDLIQELIHLSKIWSDAKRDKKFCPNEQSNDMKQCFFQIPMRQLLQNQILLSVKEIQRNAKRRNTSLGRLLSFENGSDHHRTLMYIIKGPKKRNEDEKQNTSSVKPKPRRPQSAFPSRRTLQEQSTEIDVVEQAECALHDEQQILLHRIDELRTKLDGLCRKKLEKVFIPSTKQMEALNDRLQSICDKLARNNEKKKSNGMKKKPVKLAPLKLNKIRKKEEIKGRRPLRTTRAFTHPNRKYLNV